ncbi:MAG: carbon-nitrogen hydrolase family protein [Phycisphaerae bacterium]
MSKNIHVAIGSTTSMPGDLKRNLGQIGDFARRAAADGVALLLTPEMSATGYGNYPDVLALAEAAGKGAVYVGLACLAKETGVVICAGFVEANGAKRHLAHYVVYPDGRYIVQRKHRITPVEHPLEPAVELRPVPGEESGQPVEVIINCFEVNQVRCAISICADAGIDRLSEILAEKGVELLLGPTGAGGPRAERVTTSELRTAEGLAKYTKILQTVFFVGGGAADCIKYRRGLAAVNMCGYDGRKHAHLGHGMIVNPMGEVVGFFHGIPNIDRQRPMYAHAVVDVEERV